MSEKPQDLGVDLATIGYLSCDSPEALYDLVYHKKIEGERARISFAFAVFDLDLQKAFPIILEQAEHGASHNLVETAYNSWAEYDYLGSGEC